MVFSEILRLFFDKQLPGLTVTSVPQKNIKQLSALNFSIFLKFRE